MGVISESLAEITKHGYLVLFTWITADQFGAPLPAAPILIAAGVLSGTGQLSLPIALALGVLGCLIGDTAWYAVGKWRGTAVLRTLCKISLEPESCVRRSSGFLSRYGSFALWFAKFVPGVSTVAVPLAANTDISPLAFFLNDLSAARFMSGRIWRSGASSGTSSAHWIFSPVRSRAYQRRLP